MPERRSQLAAMLDRDGTIIVDCEYTNNPDDVRVLPGAAAAIARLAAAGYPSIVVTNQSGIARGIISLAQYRSVRNRLETLLRQEGAELRDSFVCPHHPEITGPCECRKPGTGLYERAATVHELDLARCLFIGDRMRDVAPARKFGGRAVMVRSAATTNDDLAYAETEAIPVVGSLAEAVNLLLAPTT